MEQKRRINIRIQLILSVEKGNSEEQIISTDPKVPITRVAT